jgi:DNA polymerase epsilon subunit 3
LPETANVGKATRRAISHAAAVFVVYATTNSQRLAAKAHRKMVSAPDVIKAMEDMDFADFVPELEDTLKRLREEQGLKVQST